MRPGTWLLLLPLMGLPAPAIRASRVELPVLPRTTYVALPAPFEKRVDKQQTDNSEIEALLTPWSGPYGGLPPFDKATPASIERAYQSAIASKRAEVRAIASDPAPPTFENTVAALEDSGRELTRIGCLFGVFASTMNTGEMGAVARRLAPLGPALEDEIAHDDALFARIDAVHKARFAAGLSGEQQRLTSVIRDRLLRRGAGLPPGAKARLQVINGRLAGLQAKFNQNLIAEQDTQAVFLDDEADLEGLNEEMRAAAAAAAKDKGQPGRWAIPNMRPVVWPFLIKSARRDLREKVWRMWTMRGDNPGEYDNKPVIAEILRLRGEKARLLGYPDFAHLATADRMAGTPEVAMAMMQRTWASVIGPTRALIADLQALADAEGKDFRVAPWDRLYYSEKLRQARFGLDVEAVKPYLKLESVLQAMFWAAGRVHGLAFKEIPNAPVCHPSIRVFELSRAGEPVGVLWFDLFSRPGKTRGSWSSEYRTAESFRGRVLPLAAVYSNLQPAAADTPVLLTWEVANVFFHEFGHTLHMLCGGASYPSLGSLAVAWDFVELPALLNERWLYDRELLSRFAVHYRTGKPIPVEMVERIEKAARFDRVFSLNLDYLGPAIVDMRIHLEANGRGVNAVRLEEDVLKELDMPSAWDEIMRVPHSVHSFSDQYAAGIYVYLWADVMAADVAEAFARAPGGFYDKETSERWRRTVLSVGSTVPAEEAFRNFRGRDPDPDALLRRFGLKSVRLFMCPK